MAGVRHLAVPLAIAAALLAAPAASAKEGVTARLLEPLPAGAQPGRTVTIRWSLTGDDGRPFGAGGLFVVVRGHGGGKPVKAYDDGTGSGPHVAHAKVPSGGIAELRFGLDGIRMFPGGRTEDAPVYFPLENPPRLAPAAAQSAAATPRPDDGGGGTPWLPIAAALGGVAVLVAAAARVRWRRAPLRRPAA
jgi:hypothetical protein